MKIKKVDTICLGIEKMKKREKSFVVESKQGRREGKRAEMLWMMHEK